MDLCSFPHPADFTPVCTTEMSGFAQQKALLTVKKPIIGIEHRQHPFTPGMGKQCKRKMGVYLNFPIIADIDMKVSKLYGMLQPNESETAAVRAVFSLIPQGKSGSLCNIL